MPEETVAPSLIEDVSRLAAEEEWPKLVALVAALHPADLAELVMQLDEEQRPAVLEALPSDILGDLFEYVRDEDLHELVSAVGIHSLSAALEDVEHDVAADVIQELDPELREEALAALDAGDEIAELIEYESESAGGIMSHGFIALNERLTAAQAIAFLREMRPPSDRAYYLYVTDGEQHLKGVVSVRDLIVADPDTTIESFLQRDIHAVSPETDQEEAALLLRKYNLLAVPVVDEDGRLVGVTTADDLIDVLTEEATEDMYRMVGMDETERVFGPVRSSVRRRLPWMTLNLVTAFIAAGVVTLFDSTLAKATILAALMPMVAGQGGNAGTQTATIAVRSIALGELAVTDVLRAARREIMVGLANGAAIGIVAGAAVLMWEQNVALAVVLGTALALTISLATLAGVMIPLALKAMNIDPALAASIFVTAMTDIVGFFIFLGLATIAIEQIR